MDNKMMEIYVDCYDAINILINSNVIDKETYDKLRFALLADIIIAFESKIKD